MFYQQVLNENSSFRSAAEEFSLKKSTLVDAVKRYKSRMQDLQKGSPSANNDNESVRESSKFVFTPKQERVAQVQTMIMRVFGRVPSSFLLPNKREILLYTSKTAQY